MSNKLKDIDIENHAYYFFDDIINIKILIQIKSRLMKSYTKIFLFTILDVCRSKTLVKQKFIA